MMHRYPRVLILSIGLFTVRTSAEAQTVFIPDLTLRTWLNNAKPNSVDVNGNCDTAAWNAQPPSQVVIDFDMAPFGSTVDLEGIQHLKMPQVRMQDGTVNNVAIIWPGHPLNIGELWLTDVAYSSMSGPVLPLPASMDLFWCRNCDMGSVPAFNGTRLWFDDDDLGGQVLNISPSVTNLRLVNSNIAQLPSMPNVQFLYISGNPLTSWFNVPSGLVTLSANNVGLNVLPTLPTGLQTLAASGNGLISLPALPNFLSSLSVQDNQLTSIPALPVFMQTLYLDNNPLSALPAFTFFTRTISAVNCGLTTLGPWGEQMEGIWLDDNPITSVPPLPSTLEYLYLRDCTSLTCLPPLPQSLQSCWLAGSAITCLPNIPPDLYLPTVGIPAVVCTIGNSPCPLVDPLITGTTFQDGNADGVFDAWEGTRPGAVVIAQPGDLLTASDINGNYVMPADSGSFTVTGVPGLYEPVTTTPYAVTFTGIGQVDSLNHIGFTLIPGMYDLVTTIAGTNVRPGFNTSVWVHVNNVGTEPTTATVQLTFDPALTYNSSSIPAVVNGNVLDWTTGVIVPGGSWAVWVSLYAPPALILGSPVVQQATATPSQLDQTPPDNTYVLNDVVVGSFDPNDKHVEPDYLTLADVAGGTRINYTVRFQNTGTFPAERVLITDTLSSDLQWATMNFTASSHACTWYIHNGVLHVLFDNINLPDSNANEPGSHGFAKFSFVPSSSLIVGDAVDNVANIYFDYNTPVITNAATFYVETGLGVQEDGSDGLRAWPNPADDVLMIASDELLTGMVQVVDITGRVLLEKQGIGSRTALDIDDLAAGPYTVRCATANGTLALHFVKR